MTIQTTDLEAEALAMTRREAYDAMIQHCRTMIDLVDERTQKNRKLSDLKRTAPNFHSVSSFDELQAMERLAVELTPEIQSLETRLNDIEIELKVSRASVRDILSDYGFQHVQFITFEHYEKQWTIYVSLFFQSDPDTHLIRLASKS